MITYSLPNNIVRTIDTVQELCYEIYEDNISGMNENDIVAYQKTFEMLSGEDIIFFKYPSLHDLTLSIGITDAADFHFSTMYERNIFSASFLIRTYLKKRVASFNLNDSVIFVSLIYNNGAYELMLGSLSYELYPCLRPWIRRSTIDRILREM